MSISVTAAGSSAPRRPRAPAPPASRASAPHHARRDPRLLVAGPERLGEHVLQRRRALDELELAQLPVRVVRSSGRHDGRQAAARALGPGAVGAHLRLQLAEHPRPAGADERRHGGAGIRPDAAPVRPRRGLRRRPRARDDADDRRDGAPQQPRRAAGALLHRRAVGDRARARGRAHALGRAVRRLRRAGFRDEDARGAARGAGDRGGLLLGRTARSRRCGAPARRRRRRDDGRRARLAGARVADAREQPTVGVGHERQQHLVADLRLQRPRPARRADGRPGRRRRCRAAAAAASSAARRGAAALQRRAGRPGRLAAGLRRSSAAIALVDREPAAARRRAQRLGDRRRRRVRRRSRSRSARPRGSSTRTTCRCWRRSPRRWSARA